MRLNLAVKLTIRWSQVGARYYGGELEEMLGFVAYGNTLADVVSQIRSQVLNDSLHPAALIRPRDERSGTAPSTSA